MTSGNATGAPSAVHRVLLVGPDDDSRRALHLMLDRAGHQVAAMIGVEDVLGYLAANPCDVVIAWAELAQRLVGVDGSSPMIAVVRSRDLAMCWSLLEAGVDDVVTEPLDELALALALRHVATVARKVVVRAAPVSLVGDGAAMQQLRSMIERIAAHRTTVLILGESGTGKELVARAIHDASPRQGKRFVAINCAAIPAALLESELFGHKKGAFTDAVRDKLGLFEDADGGTLFLDEVGELPLPLQAKLLRVLQDGEIRPVGDNTPVKVDVRLVAATLRDLALDVAEGRFREDLYYRLNVVPVAIPPLRERSEDIPQLARLFAQRHAARHQRASIELSDAALEALRHQRWPGNVRELENVIERALVLSEGPAIDLEFLGTVMNVRPTLPPIETETEGGNRFSVRRSKDRNHLAPKEPLEGETDELSIKKATRELERALIARALGVTQGNRTNAAKLLEISHRALLYKMKDYGIS